MRAIAWVIGIGMVLLAGLPLAARQTTAGVDAFNEHVAAYAALHRQAERFLPPQRNYIDPEEGLAYAAALRRALCTLRPHAREGDIFAPAAGEIRRRARYALRANGIEIRDLLLEMMTTPRRARAHPPSTSRFHGRWVT